MTSPALAALRERRAELGLKRFELYVHPDDWDAVKRHAAALQKRRENPEPPPPAPKAPPAPVKTAAQRLQRRLARGRR